MTVVLTGATSGIGQAAARLLAPQVTRLILHGPQRPQEVTGQLEKLRAAGPGEVHYVHADFDSLAMVRALASEISKITDRVDVLINNAGRPGAPRRRLSHDGNEATLQTNYLAAVLLTERLTPLLLPSGGRVVHVASATHLSTSLDPDDLNLERSHYSATTAYARSKLALVAHARWLVEQAAPPQPDTVSLHPGVISTELLHAMFDIGGDSVVHGAHNVVNTALSTGRWAGQYLDERRPVQPNPITLDADFRHRLAHRTFDLLHRSGKAPEEAEALP
ncbi:SDR family NAD(P)-dependent oxidoreductase [Streptomyces sp. PSKA54]|uniref:SDR family NAD(P)-dependent oxidoreductase n=1 Tax=Streptomyces himalayensis subsp. aureolus TaxID=2758039 RepID=A0A7W2D9E3_9ACTN|nr:SDR family NAD(P)-dependent oxidoreductase [Streptomyces himalayensis]MBA4867056.1 SDR family NAD(P)-dependent oxidoreductase [Streptomyces himalayensis subsp. aureolus]